MQNENNNLQKLNNNFDIKKENQEVENQKANEIFNKELDDLFANINFDSIFINIYSLFEIAIQMGTKRYSEGLDKKYLNIVNESQKLLKNLNKEEKIKLLKDNILFIVKNS